MTIDGVPGDSSTVGHISEDAITADILKNGKSICFERTWPFDAHGHVDEVIVFDPDSQPIDGGDDA